MFLTKNDNWFYFSVILFYIILSLIGLYIKQCSPVEPISKNPIIEENKIIEDSITKLDSIKEHEIIEVRNMSDSDAVELFKELLKR